MKGAYDLWKLVEDHKMAREAFVMIGVTLQECGKSEQALECVKAAYDISSQACNLSEKLEDEGSVRVGTYPLHAVAA